MIEGPSVRRALFLRALSPSRVGDNWELVPKAAAQRGRSTHSCPWPISQRTTGLPWHLTFDHAASTETAVVRGWPPSPGKGSRLNDCIRRPRTGAPDRGCVKTHRAAEMPEVVVSFAAVRSILTVPRASNRKASHSREIVFAFSHSLDPERKLTALLRRRSPFHFGGCLRSARWNERVMRHRRHEMNWPGPIS